MLWLLYSAIPAGVAIGFWAVPVSILDLLSRSILHAFAFLVCYFPYHLGRFLSQRGSPWATGAYLSANALRIAGIFMVLFIFQYHSPFKTIPALELYAISVGSFLFFQLVALGLFRKNGKSQDKIR